MKKNYISTEDTKKILGIDSSGIKKLRLIYRKHGRLKERELFTTEMLPELLEIVKWQRANPHSSFENAYDFVIAKAALTKILTISDDDLTMRAEAVLGEEGLEQYFEHFNALIDLIGVHDEDCKNFLISQQSLLLAKIISKKPVNDTPNISKV